MDFSKILIGVCCCVVGLPLMAATLFEFWKKIWITTAGEVIAVEKAGRIQKSMYNTEQMKVRIRYRFFARNKEYISAEIRLLDMPAYMDAAYFAGQVAEFPIGGKIAVFHPRSLPEISSITPGGALMPKLLTSFVAIGFLIWLVLFD
jgi:hypothetical protein